MLLLAFCCVITVAFIGYLLYDKHRFDVQRDTIPYRIHVNGIRGKSSVTRYVTAVLRDSGIHTYGKTTGTAARIIMPDGQDRAVARRGSANVTEQVGIIRSFAAEGAGAIVMECMAINPDYQDWLENKVMHSHITIITNVRLDHQEEMGDTLNEIAQSLARSIPHNAILITAERQPEILKIFLEECRRKRSRLIVAPVDAVTPTYLASFDHMAHADNVAIGLAVAKLFNISPKKALRAMACAPADPGAFHVEHLKLHNKDVVWANLFAVNDKESFAQTAALLAKQFPDHSRIVMLNNRHDRPSRVEMFSELAQNEYRADTIVALGDYEERVRASIRRKDVTLALMGNRSKFATRSGDELIKTIVGLAERPQVLLVGTVNIHSRQSEQILAYLDKLTGNNKAATVPAYKPYTKRRLPRHTTPKVIVPTAYSLRMPRSYVRTVAEEGTRV